jgi:hypothetical protein
MTQKLITNLINLLETKDMGCDLVDEVIQKNSDLLNIVKKTIKHLKDVSGVCNIGIRIRDKDNDYPYFIYHGFTDEFIRLENSLLIKDEKGNIVYSDGELTKPALDCMCGNILEGRFDSSKLFFTEKGSFWCTNTNRLEETKTILPCGANAHLRGVCNSMGYMTVILIPIIIEDNNIIGLVQLNDTKEKFFEKNYIKYLETLVDILALSIQNHLIYERFYKVKKELKELRAKM